MKVWSLPSLQSVTSFEDLRRFTAQALTNFAQILSRNVGFQDNINCQIVEFSGTSGTEVAVNHTLGVVPIGFIVIGVDNYGVLAGGVGTFTTAWTNTTVYFLPSVTANFKVILLGS